MPSITEKEADRIINLNVKVPEERMRLLRSKAALRGVEIRTAINEAIDLWLKKKEVAA